MSGSKQQSTVLPQIYSGNIPSRIRSRSNVEDSISSLRQNLFLKLEKYDMESRNETNSKSMIQSSFYDQKEIPKKDSIGITPAKDSSRGDSRNALSLD